MFYIQEGYCKECSTNLKYNENASIDLGVSVYYCESCMRDLFNVMIDNNKKKFGNKNVD